MHKQKSFSDLKSLTTALTDDLTRLAEDTVSRRGRFLLALNGGGTPQQLFEMLGLPPYQAMPFWSGTLVFWGDERCVPPDEPGSSYKQAYDAFLSRVPIPPEQIYRIQGELPPVKAAKEYAEQLARLAQPDRSWPRFDLVLLGMGADGHTASLFPGQHHGDESTAAIPVTAEYEDRPANRVSLTPAVFNDARHVFFMAAGSSKAPALQAVLHGPENPHAYPAQYIRPKTGEVTWYLDEAILKSTHAS